MLHSRGRRRVLAGAGAAIVASVLDACGARVVRPAQQLQQSSQLQLPPLHAEFDRITAITVCTRPFRPQGPRLDAERLGDKLVVHNYGHGGSGWSLSWGSSSVATQKALATGQREFAVVGCGALGLTSALLLQRAGARVTIYAKDLPPNVRSSLATGVWSQDSRICLAQHATPEFRALWETMARRSWQAYQALLGLAGEPVEYFDHYTAVDVAAPGQDRNGDDDARPAFARLERELLDDLVPLSKEFSPGTHPFGARLLRRTPWLMFNLNAYVRLLMSDFVAGGGRIRITEFRSRTDLQALPEQTLINATGYGARALFDDDSIVPIRGQIARMIPQPDIRYGLSYKDSSFVPRRDGMVFQVVGDSDYYGFGDDTTVPNRAEAEHAVTTIGSLFA